MSNLKVKSASGSYEIEIEVGLAPELHEHTIVLVDSNVPKPNWLQDFAKESPVDQIISLRGDESVKTFLGVEAILLELSARRATREHSLLAIGGGSVQDAVTLAASLYMRGIPWVYMPSTMMAMMDSCIGGKSSINVGPQKNLAGNFYPPKHVLIDPSLTDSLSDAAVVSGLAEGAKICYAVGTERFLHFQELVIKWRKTRDHEVLGEMIYLTLDSKRHFIEIDEFDRRERKLLNFGHTYGHALEAGSHFQIPHGIAIAIGMLAAIYQSGQAHPTLELSHFLVAELNRVKSSWLDFDLDWEVIHETMLRDKKNSDSEQRLILPDDNGRLQVISIPLNDRSIANSVEALRSTFKELGCNW